MAKERFIPEVLDENADRAVSPISQFQAEVARNPLVNGVMVEIDVTTSGSQKVPHGLGRRPVGCLVVGADVGVFAASLLETDPEVATVAFARTWEVLGRLEFNANLYPTAVSSDNFAHTPSPVVDYEYKIEGRVSFDQPLSGYNLYWNINGNYSGGYSTVSEKGASSTQQAGVLLTYNNIEDSFSYVSSILTFPGDGYGYCLGRSTTRRTSTTVLGNDINAVTGDLSGGLSSLGVNADTGDISVGSEFTLSRRPRLVGRKLNLWIF